jgi:putative transposase
MDDIVTNGFNHWNRNIIILKKNKKMANTYHQIHIQAVFAVKYRNAVLDKAWRDELFAVIGNLINETGCKSLIVNGVEDHVHCFFSLKPSVSLSDVMQSVKAKSSKWLNEQKLLEHRFEWQKGSGLFSYNHALLEKVYKYVENQEVHHATHTFKDEYIALLKIFEIDYDESYVFEDLI